MQPNPVIYQDLEFTQDLVVREDRVRSRSLTIYADRSATLEWSDGDEMQVPEGDWQWPLLPMAEFKAECARRRGAKLAQSVRYDLRHAARALGGIWDRREMYWLMPDTRRRDILRLLNDGVPAQDLPRVLIFGEETQEPGGEEPAEEETPPVTIPRGPRCEACGEPIETPSQTVPNHCRACSRAIYALG